MAHEDPDELLRRTLEVVSNHRKTYIASGGTSGHLMDMSHVGVDRFIPTLLLETTGRRSGQRRIVPLNYGFYAGEWVVIASKGGAPEHPAWYLNLQGGKQIRFQVATQCFHGSWREAQGAEREAVWACMARDFPPYHGYQESAGARVIPVILLKPVKPCPVFKISEFPPLEA